MYQSIWKLSALAVVVGIGVLVVVQAQRGFNKAESDAVLEQEPVEAAPERAENDPLGEWDTLSSQVEPPPSLDDETLAVPASAKMSSAGRKERSAALDDDDPFAPSEKPLNDAPRRAARGTGNGIGDRGPGTGDLPRTTARDRAAGRTRARLEAADDDASIDEAPSSRRGLEQAEDDPFATGSRRKPDAAATKPSKIRGGPAFRLNALEDDDQAANEKPADLPTEDKYGDAKSGPKLLGEDDDATITRLSPIAGDDSDPFGEDKPAPRRARTEVAPAEKEDGGDDVPDLSADDNAPKKLPGSARAPADDRESADDEMPIVERAAPRRKPAAPAVPRAAEENDDDAEAFPTIDKPADDRQEPRRLTPERNPAIPLDDEPAAPAAKSPARTRSDPFGDDEPEETTRAPQASLKRADDDKSTPLGRPAAPAMDDEDGPASRQARPSTRPPTDEADDSAAFGVEPGRSRPSRSSPPREEAPVIGTPATVPDEDQVRESPPPSAQKPSAPRRASQPQLTIDKIAPPTAVLGKPMVYQILVKNVGKIPARQVVVEDAVPDAARIDGSIPQALLDKQRLVWKLGTLEAGQEKKILVRMIPQSEGTLGTVATVNCASSDAGTNPAAPQLSIDMDTPSQAVVGTPVVLKFRVTNVGAVDATGVVIRNVLPAGLKHHLGDDLEFEIASLPAGKSHEVELEATAARVGKAVNRAIVTSGNVTEEATAALDIVGPALSVTRTGSKRLFPGKTGAYTNTVTNPGSQPITNVRVVETIPPGMEFASASDGGEYDKAKRTVTWALSQLGPNESKSLKSTLNASGRGAQISVVRASDASGASGETVGTTQVAGVPALTIDIGELAPHIDVGEQVRIPLRVFNRGSDTATGIRVSVSLPYGMQLVSVHPDVKYKMGIDFDEGGSGKAESGRSAFDRESSWSVIQFAPISRLDPRSDAKIELTLKASQAGNARLRVEVECEQVGEPVRREEVTTVAAKEE